VHGDLHSPLGQAGGQRGDPGRRGADLGGEVVGQQQDAQGPPAAGERERIARVYAGYRVDPAKHRAWDAANPGNLAMREEVARAILAEVPGLAGGDGLVLDAGCGSGWWLQRLVAAGVDPARLVGVDLLDERVAAARERVPGARVAAGDIRSLDLPEASCGLVSFLTVLSAMRDEAAMREALGEARRVLAPGGVIAVWEPRVRTRNRHTRHVSLRLLAEAGGAAPRARSITLAPPLARHAGRAYGALARVPLLRSHRLVTLRPR
jgi:SAM-dependent methyltransferase